MGGSLNFWGDEDVACKCKALLFLARAMPMHAGGANTEERSEGRTTDISLVSSHFSFHELSQSESTVLVDVLMEYHHYSCACMRCLTLSTGGGGQQFASES